MWIPVVKSLLSHSSPQSKSRSDDSLTHGRCHLVCRCWIGSAHESSAYRGGKSQHLPNTLKNNLENFDLTVPMTEVFGLESLVLSWEQQVFCALAARGCPFVVSNLYHLLILNSEFTHFRRLPHGLPIFLWCSPFFLVEDHVHIKKENKFTDQRTFLKQVFRLR